MSEVTTTSSVENRGSPAPRSDALTNVPLSRLFNDKQELLSSAMFELLKSILKKNVNQL